jgi:glutamate-1-semialdehyde 2,1-aminomutase
MRLRDTTRFLDPTSLSARKAGQAQLVFQDGITRETIRRRPHSPSQERGRGAQLVDVDGDERIDFLFNHASLIHGHCYPPVTNAITEQANRIGAVSFPSGLEEQLGRELLQRTVIRPARIRFVNSGTEAVMLAIGAARRATGRPKILRFDGCYHGSLLALGPGHDPARRGTGEVVCAFNDPAEVEEALEREGPRLACVLLDPYPSRGALAPAHRDFLAVVESLRRRHGVLLVVDEIVSSRLAYQGAASQLGLSPDVVCLGKYIGGGLPVGAVVMRPELAALFASERGPVIAHGGTFNGNPVTMAAGIACLRHLDDDQIGRINALTAALAPSCKESSAVTARSGRCNTPAPCSTFGRGGHRRTRQGMRASPRTGVSSPGSPSSCSVMVWCSRRRGLAAWPPLPRPATWSTCSTPWTGSWPTPPVPGQAMVRDRRGSSPITARLLAERVLDPGRGAEAERLEHNGEQAVVANQQYELYHAALAERGRKPRVGGVVHAAVGDDPGHEPPGGLAGVGTCRRKATAQPVQVVPRQQSRGRGHGLVGAPLVAGAPVRGHGEDGGLGGLPRQRGLLPKRRPDPLNRVPDGRRPEQRVERSQQLPRRADHGRDLREPGARGDHGPVQPPGLRGHDRREQRS